MRTASWRWGSRHGRGLGQEGRPWVSCKQHGKSDEGKCRKAGFWGLDKQAAQGQAGADSHTLRIQASVLLPVFAFVPLRCGLRCTAGCRASPHQCSGGVWLLRFGCRVVGALGVQQYLGWAHATLISIVVCQGASGHKILTLSHSISPVPAQQPVHMRLVQLGTARQDTPNLSPLPFLPTVPPLLTRPLHPFLHIPFPLCHTCACAALSGVCGWCSGACETGWRQYARRRGSWWKGGCHLIAVTTRCSWCSCLSQSCTQVRRQGAAERGRVWWIGLESGG